MKSAENKTTTASAQPQNKAAQPFFQKKGADSALSSGQDFFAFEASAERFFQPAPAFIQAQLAIGAPNDPYEQEADKVAGQVMEGYDQASSIQRKLSDFGVQHTLIQPMTIGSRISRKIQRILSRTPLVAQAKCTDCEKEEKMQQKSAAIQFAGEGATVSPDIEAKIHSMRGGGQSMDAQTKGAMESSFGADFSNIRVHTGNQAVQMSQNLNAHAFTVGSDIFFNEGRYQPQTKQGAGLLAHELTHTVQQGAALQNKRIDRQPLANLLSGHTAAHLSAMSGQAGLYRQEIAQLQRGPEEDLQMKGVDQVQKKDGAGMLRRCDGGRSAAATRPTLKKRQVSAPVSTDCGGFDWPIMWGLNNPGSANGWIVQKVELITNVTNCSGAAFDHEHGPGLKPSWYPLWEAWEVKNGIIYGGPSSNPPVSTFGLSDAYGQAPLGSNTKGNMTVRGTAEYYDGLTLPSSFVVTNAPPAHILPATTTQPTLTGGTGSISHNLTATWDCCSTNKNTVITTV